METKEVMARNEQIAELKRAGVPDTCKLLDQNHDITQESWKSDACEGCKHYENGECLQL